MLGVVPRRAAGSPTASDSAHDLHELDGGGRVEVADRRAGEEHDDSRGRPFRFRQRERLREVGASRQNLQPGIGGSDSLRGRHQVCPRDVHRHVGGEVRQPVEEQPGLGAGAAAQLNEQGVRADAIRDLLGMRREDLRLRASHVVLGKLANFVEKLGAPLVVEI